MIHISKNIAAMVTNKMGFVFKKNPVLKPKFKVTKHLHIIMCLYPIFWTFLKTAQTFYKYLVAYPVKYHAISSLGSKCFLCKKYFTWICSFCKLTWIFLVITSFCSHLTYIGTLWNEAINDPMEMFCPDTPFCNHIWSRVELFRDL